jgi:PIN domain nuclease of toxin-antitoxin system
MNLLLDTQAFLWLAGEGWDIVSKDPEFSAYGVPVIW